MAPTPSPPLGLPRTAVLCPHHVLQRNLLLVPRPHSATHSSHRVPAASPTALPVSPGASPTVHSVPPAVTYTFPRVLRLSHTVLLVSLHSHPHLTLCSQHRYPQAILCHLQLTPRVPVILPTSGSVDPLCNLQLCSRPRPSPTAQSMSPGVTHHSPHASALSPTAHPTSPGRHPQLLL